MAYDNSYLLFLLGHCGNTVQLKTLIINLSAPPSVSITPQVITVQSGSVLQLQCTAQGAQPITIEWTKVDGVLSTAAYERDGVLRIQPVTPVDAGRYRCVASGPGGRSEQYAEVSVIGGSESALPKSWSRVLNVDSSISSSQGIGNS